MPSNEGHLCLINYILSRIMKCGRYASHFVLACHANHIGSCIFQLPIAYESIDRIRQVAHIPNNYAIICAVGFGKPKTQVKRLMASRKPIGDYAEIF